MKARPILFSAPMIRALMAGTKTQTRRIAKPQPEQESMGHPYWHVGGFRLCPGINNPLPCPYGQPTDLIWCKETFAGFIQTNYENDEWREAETDELREQYPMTIEYRATSESLPDKWRPSLFMPRWASRLTLEITDVRVERLQDISEDDAEAEGVDMSPVEMGIKIASVEYMHLWESINGSGSWEKNPFVWALTFRVHQKNVDDFMKGKI